MAVKIRLKRTGRKHIASYRIVAMDVRSSRDGEVLERLGVYSPEFPQEEQQLTVKADRVEYWLSKGAQPTKTVASLLRKKGIKRGAAQAAAAK